jgi:hypothetical protein
MKSRILTFLILTVATGFAAFMHTPFQGPPPKAEEIGEIMFERRDFSGNNSWHITISREDFLRFFSEGTFSTDFKSMEAIRSMPPDLNEKGGRNFCTGHFATKDGKVFEFNRYNPKALEITDSSYRTGWFILK